MVPLEESVVRHAIRRAKREEEELAANAICTVHVDGRSGPAVCLWRQHAGNLHALCAECLEEWKEAGHPADLIWLDLPSDHESAEPCRIDALVAWGSAVGKDLRWEAQPL